MQKCSYFVVVALISSVLSYDPDPTNPDAEDKIIWGLAWILFVVGNEIIYSILLLLSVRKVIQVYRETYNKYFNFRLGFTMMIHIIFICIFRILFFVDPKGLEKIYKPAITAVLLRVPQLLIMACYLFVILFWKQLEKGTLIDARKTILIPVIILISILFLICLPATLLGSFGVMSVNMLFISNSIFASYCFAFMIGGAIYAYRLSKTVKQHNLSVGKHNILSKIRSMSLVGFSLTIILIITLLWRMIDINLINDPWRLYFYYVLVHSTEIGATMIVYVAVSQGSERGKKKRFNERENLWAKDRFNIK